MNTTRYNSYIRIFLILIGLLSFIICFYYKSLNWGYVLIISLMLVAIFHYYFQTDHQNKDKRILLYSLIGFLVMGLVLYYLILQKKSLGL